MKHLHPRSAWSNFLTGAFFVLVSLHAASAANGTWTNDISGGLWSTAANWNGGTIADASGSTADFNTINLTTDPTVVHLDSARTLGNLTFGDTDTSSVAGWILDNNNVAGNTLTLAGGTPTITVNALGTGASAIVGPVIAGSTRWVKAGNGSLILTNANTFTAGLNLSVGTLTATNAGALGAFGATATNTITGTLNLNAGSVIYNGLTNNTLNGSGTINVALGTGSGSAVITTITNANFSGFNGTINIGTNGLTGEVAAAAAGKAAIFSAFGSGATVNVLPNAALYIGGSFSTNRGAITLYGGDNGETGGQLRLDTGAVWAGPVTLAGPVTGTSDGNVGSVSGGGNITGPIGQIGGAQNLVKVGASTLTLSGTNTYTGYTTNLAGTLKLGNARALGDGVNNTAGLVIAGASILDFAAITPLAIVPLTMDSTANAFDVGAIENNTASTTNIFGGPVTLLRQTRFGGAGVMLFTNTINGNVNNLIKDSTGALQFRNNGVVALGTLTGNRGTLQVEAGTFVTVTNMNIGSGTGVGAGLTLAGGSVTNLGNTRFGTGGSGAAGTLTLNSGTLTVTNLAQGARTFNINFNGATLIAAASQTAFLPTATSAKVQAGNAIIDDGGNAITIGASLVADGASPGGGLIKRGSGILTLTGANTYTGSTLITNGTLALSGGVSIASSGNIAIAAGTTFLVSDLGTFTIAANQTLSGHGTVIGNVTDVANAKISPGGNGSIGTLNFANDLTLAGGDSLNFDFSNGGSNDLITVAGTVNPTGVTTINLANWPLTNGFPVGTYVLLQATNSLAGSTNNFVLGHQPGRQSMSLVYDTDASPNQLLLVVPSLPGNIGNLVWQGGQNANAWDVQTTSNWLNGVSGDVFYQSDTVLFSNVPPANTSVNLAQDVAPGTVIFQGTNDYVISGSYKITGAASLTQNGSGTVTLNTANDYSGGTTINSGALQLGDSVSYAGAVAGDITNNASLVVANPYDLEFSTTVIGPGQLVKTGPNTLTLTTAQPYTGGTVISAGTLQLGNGGAAGALSPSGVINNSGILSLNRSSTTSQGTNFGSITGTGSVQHLTAGLVNLTTSNSHSGGTTLFGSGRIQISDSRAFGFGKVYLKSTQSSFFATLSLTGGLTVTNDIEIDSTTGRENIEMLTGTNTLTGNISITGAGANTIIVQNNSTQPFYLGGDIAGADFTGSVSFRGNTPNNTIMSTAQINLPNGRIDFSPNTSNNDWTIESVGNIWTKVTMGGTAVAKVTLAANNGLATNAPVAWATGSAITLNLNGQNQTVAGLDLASTTSTPTISNGSTNSDSILTLAGLAVDYTYAGVIKDGAARKVGLVMNSAGRTQTLSGINAYTGNTTVTAGTLVIQQPTLASNSTVSVAVAALLQLDFAGAETNQVAALMLNGANQPPGVYSSNTHPAYLAGAGSLLVVPTMASYPTNITASVSGGTLTLAWPETHLGWYAQSNSVSLADTNYWFDIPNSQLSTNLIITLNPAQTNVFYRLRHP